MKKLSKLALALAFAMFVAACGADDAVTEVAEDAGDVVEEVVEEGEEAMEDEEEAMEDEEEAMEDEEEAMEDEEEAMEDEEAMADLPDLTIVSIDFETNEVTFANHTDADIAIDGYYLCNFPDYAALSAADPVPAGGTLTVTSTVAISADDGELGLYSEGGAFGDPDTIAAYVEWGSEGHERSSTAVQAGVHDGSVATVADSVLTVG